MIHRTDTVSSSARGKSGKKLSRCNNEHFSVLTLPELEDQTYALTPPNIPVPFLVLCCLGENQVSFLIKPIHFIDNFSLAASFLRSHTWGTSVTGTNAAHSWGPQLWLPRNTVEMGAERDGAKSPWWWKEMVTDMM